MIENRKELISARRRLRSWQGCFAARYGRMSRYAEYVAGIPDVDMSSRIFVEIPSYDDPDTVNTILSALHAAANPSRISFGICLQSDDMEMLDCIKAVDRCRVVHYPKADAPGACRARYDCQAMLRDEDFVMHADAHMRFAPGWDVFFIDQWRMCRHDKAVLSCPGIKLSTDMAGLPFDDAVFVRSCSHIPMILVPLYFYGGPCMLVVGAQWAADAAGQVLPGAFMTAHCVFSVAAFDRDVRVDPYMNFSGDEEPVLIRAYEKGFRFFHPSMVPVFHKHDSERHAQSAQVVSGLQGRQNLRYEALLGLRNDVDLGEYGLSDMSSLYDYEEYAGICFRAMSITDNASKGVYGAGLYSVPSEADVCLAESRNDARSVSTIHAGSRSATASFSDLRSEMPARDRDELCRALIAGDMDRLPSAGYLRFLSNIPSFDLTSRILVEIPAYCDPEVVPTVQSALLNAANPNRIHFAICLQDDDEGKLAALRSVPGCRVVHFRKADAPGLCAARYECHKLLDGEEFVLHVDSHMRFARYWDAALPFSWRQCRDHRAILTDYAVPLSLVDLSRPLDDDFFVSYVDMCGRPVSPHYFRTGECDLRFRANGSFSELKPKRGAFMGGHFVFGRAEIDSEVPCDPLMDFSADEDSMAARYWTHGFNLYQCSPRYVYHLYDRETKYGTAVKSNDAGSARRTRQQKRMNVLFGICDEPGVSLLGFGLGTARSLAEYESYAGVDFRRQLIRKFSFDGRFDCERTDDDMLAADWYDEYVAQNGCAPCWGTRPDFTVSRIVLDDLKSFCDASGYRPEMVVNMAVQEFVNRQRRYGR